MERKKCKPEAIKCERCGKKILKRAAITFEGKLYCCLDCAIGGICDCQ